MNLLSNEIFYRAKYARPKKAEQILGTKRKYLFSKLCNLIPRCFWSCFLSALPYRSLCQDFEKSGSSLFYVFLVFVLFSVAIGGNITCFGKTLNLELRCERRKNNFQIFCFENLLAVQPASHPPLLTRDLNLFSFRNIYSQDIHQRLNKQTKRKVRVCMHVYLLCACMQSFCKYITPWEGGICQVQVKT